MPAVEVAARGRSSPTAVAEVLVHSGAQRTLALRRAWWVTTTTLVALGSFAGGLVALWAASAIAHAPFVATAMRWDASWYYRISQHGYSAALPTRSTQYTAIRPAFFPGLPLVERAVHGLIGGPPAATTLVVGALGLLTSCLLLRALVERIFTPEAAWRATVLLAFFPGTYAFVMGYSEIVAIPLAVFALYAVRRRWYLAAGAATALATGTRLLGVALVAALVVAAARELALAVRGSRAQWPQLASAVVSPLLGLGGLVAYMVYLHQRTGSFLAFSTAERVGWHNTVSLAQPYDTLRAFVDKPLVFPWVTVNAAGVLAVLACLVLLGLVAWRYLNAEEMTYAVVILLAWLFTSNTGAWFRFVLSAFPVLVVAALRLNRRAFPVVACAGAMLLGILVVLFGATSTFSP